jgi:NAD(P)-dependent dehydrogenase (short-subunit alcohol dehydrogenase family)
VTGATRGIGLAFVQLLVTRPNTIVYAGVRSLPLAPSSELAQLAAEHREVLFPIEITSGDEADNAAAAATITARYGMVHVVIANAGQPHFLLAPAHFLPPVSSVFIESS